MKIVNLEAFRQMPSNTLFAKYEPCVFEELEIKGKTLEHDFLVTSSLSSAIKCSGWTHLGDLLDQAERTGESLAMDFETEGRDGCFEKDQLFAVWEEADVLALIERLKRCLPDTDPPNQLSGESPQNQKP